MTAAHGFRAVPGGGISDGRGRVRRVRRRGSPAGPAGRGRRGEAGPRAAAAHGCRALSAPGGARHHRVLAAAPSLGCHPAQAALLFAAFVHAVPGGEGDRARDVRCDAWYAAALTGLATGIKVSAAVPALVIATMTVLFPVAWSATAAYWYVRNALFMGNPLYPAAFPGIPGTTFPETTLIEYGRRYGAGKALADAARVYLDWPYLHGATGVAGLTALAVWLCWRSPRRACWPPPTPGLRRRQPSPRLPWARRSARACCGGSGGTGGICTVRSPPPWCSCSPPGSGWSVEESREPRASARARAPVRRAWTRRSEGGS